VVLIKNLDEANLAALSVLSNSLIACIFSVYAICRYFVILLSTALTVAIGQRDGHLPFLAACHYS